MFPVDICKCGLQLKLTDSGNSVNMALTEFSWCHLSNVAHITVPSTAVYTTMHSKPLKKLLANIQYVEQLGQDWSFLLGHAVSWSLSKSCAIRI